MQPVRHRPGRTGSRERRRRLAQPVRYCLQSLGGTAETAEDDLAAWWLRAGARGRRRCAPSKLLRDASDERDLIFAHPG